MSQVKILCKRIKKCTKLGVADYTMTALRADACKAGNI